MIEQLQRALEEAERKIQEADRKTQEANRKTQDAEREKQELEDRLEQQKTTFDEYLADSHSVLDNFEIAKIDPSSIGRSTKVDNRRYPVSLREWTEFPELHEGYFVIIQRALGHSRLFPTSGFNHFIPDAVLGHPAVVEDDVKRFENVAVERPIERIFEALLIAEPRYGDKFGFSGMRFHHRERSLRLLDNGETDATQEPDEAMRGRSQSRPSKRVASESQVDTPTYPDGLCFRKPPGDAADTLAFVFDYKAAHKLMVEDVRMALREDLFMEVVQRINSNKITTDDTHKQQEAADLQAAMALTQVFSYMLLRGVTYGYVTAGKTLILLHIKLDDVRTLYYHLSTPDDCTKLPCQDQGIAVSQTGVAKLASFCLLSFQSKPLQGVELLRLKDTPGLRRWPYPYDEAENTDSTQKSSPPSQESDGSLYEDTSGGGVLETRKYPTRSRGRCRDTTPQGQRTDDEDDGSNDRFHGPARAEGTAGSNKRKAAPLSSSPADSGRGQSSDNSDGQSIRQYCTQACLLGLKRGSHLDDNCPNVSSHRIPEDATHHSLTADQFISQLDKQLGRNVYHKCIAVDPYGLGGKIGAIGALFKLELEPYGYTIVAKGAQAAHRRRLQHESFVYSKLETLQGEFIPVHLGLISVADPRGYILPGGALVFHMMIMSWCGERATEAVVPDLASQVRLATSAVWREGVDQGDDHSLNMLWSNERQRVMVIDFDLATLRPPPKPKQVLEVSSGSKRKRHRDGGTGTHGQKRKTSSKFRGAD
ncbi:hypothetical protein B0T25DRAFT_458360 [Lasiosphaeria hispida]|uniref:Aminoglycoside phosphotransferase domain-containing protein n=1 Tax=Lasiosphaeria hispida TaxID=260671 RepID=A0AAJ0HGD6_9PEZI|nr:hypothetical protein B0T25DRAFT_458360 [Lasiosphaeria hispida]